MIRHQLHQVELDEDRWIRLAAAILSRNVASLALVTPMYYQNIRLKDLDIVRISDNRAMLVQILDGGRVQRTLVHLTGEVMWPEIEKFVAEISRRYRGLTSIELQTAYPLAKDHIERQILDASINLLDQAREQYDGEPVFYGLTEVLNQPEFYTDGELFVVDFDDWNFAVENIDVYDTADLGYMRSMNVAPDVAFTGLTGDDSRNALYAVDQFSNTIYQMHPENGSIMNQWSSGVMGEQGLAILGNELFIAAAGVSVVPDTEIVVLDLETREELRRFQMPFELISGLGGDGASAAAIPSDAAALT